MGKVFELTTGDILVVSLFGIMTVVFRRPAEFTGGLGAVKAMRTIADAVEEALEAQKPFERPGICRPA